MIRQHVLWLKAPHGTVGTGLVVFFGGIESVVTTDQATFHIVFTLKHEVARQNIVMVYFQIILTAVCRKQKE